MAVQDYAATATALEQRFRARVQRQPNRATVTLNLLSNRPGSGKNVAYDVTVGTATGQVFDDGEDVVVYNADTDLPATLAWAEYGDAFAITGRAEDAANGDGTELARLYLNKMMGARDRTAQKINTDIWTGAGTASPQKLLGITTAAGPLDSTGVYAGIDRSTYPQWAGNVYGNSGLTRSVSIGLVEQAFEGTYLAAGTAVDAMVTTPAIHRRLAELVAPNRRFVQQVNIRGQKITLEAGYHAIEINGVPVFKDKDAPTGYLGGLALDHIGIEYLPVADARKDSDYLGMYPISGTPEEQAMKEGFMGGAPLMAALWKLSRNGNKRKLQLLTTIQMWCDKPNANFIIKDLG